MVVTCDIPVDVGMPVAVAVRPEKISIDRRKPEADVNAMTGKVMDLGYFGKDSLYRVKLPSNALVLVVTGRGLLGRWYWRFMALSCEIW